MVNALHPVFLQFLALVQRDGAAATAEYADVLSATLAQQVDHVLEELDVPTLIGGNGDGVGVFLDGCAHDVQHAAVVAEVDDFRALRLDQAAHDVDGGVMAVKQ